jgi:hypothetical protein
MTVKTVMTVKTDGVAWEVPTLKASRVIELETCHHHRTITQDSDLTHTQRRLYVAEVSRLQ